MTPLSITLQNFLCYGTQDGGAPYVFDFRDHRLWSISGDNGAGKSAIFDAITYCLYGEHRGGSQRDQELVRRGETEMLARYEFEHGGKEFRVTRTVRLGFRPRKGTPTVQRECRMEWLREDGEWVDVPETSSSAGLEAAVRKILGFGCETLTASVLLLQGKSDKLIDAGGADRFKILSGILDLSRYERLAERARERARDAKVSHQRLAVALEAAKPPEEAEVEAAELSAAGVEKDAEAATAAKASAEKALEAVEQYWARVKKLNSLCTEADEMAEALRDEATIKEEAAEAEVLAATLPRLRTALDAETAAATAAREAEEARKAAGEVDLSVGAKAATRAHEVHQDLRRKLGLIVAEISKTNSELVEITTACESARQLDGLESQIRTAAAEVALLEKQCAGIDELRNEAERLRNLVAARPLIASYKKAREALATAEGIAADGDPDAELRRRRERREELYEAAQLVAKGHAGAERTLATRAAQLEEAERIVREREAAGEEGTCSHCGQVVSAAHIKVELTNARASVAKLKVAVTAARRALEEALTLREQADAEVEAARLAEAEAANSAKAAREARETLREIELAEDFRALPVDVREVLTGPLADLVAGIAALTRAPVELEALEQRLVRLGKAEASARAKTELIAGWERAVALIVDATPREHLAEAKVRDAALRAQVAGLQSREKELRDAEEIAAGAAAAAQNDLQESKEKKQELEQLVRLREQAAAGSRQEAMAALTGVKESYLPVTAAVIKLAEQRLDELGGAADRLALLRKAETDLAGVRGQIKQLQADMDATPQAQRTPAEDARLGVISATERAEDAKQGAKVARRAADELRRARDEGLKSQAELQALARAKAVWERVDKLLGKGGIQTALMRSALEDIQEGANSVLSRISGGQLQLAINCDDTSRGQEIHFRCLDASSAEQPLDVQFLSGGQRFRCAVALAAGIGQHAGSGGSLPSQIIDEGFGSLDAQGRTEMLTEVRQMSEFYQRVIVVSHMETFHDQALFPARYELRKDGMRTVVTASL